MILSAFDLADLPAVARRFAGHLPVGGPARAALARIVDSAGLIAGGIDTAADRAAACRLAESFGIPTLDEEPAAAFSWDGVVLRARSEASVVIHEVAHWLVAPPVRRGRLDFGLGAGPETGRVAEAEAAAAVDEETRQTEETLASLLGILWEVELGQPGLLAFLEQNWLEGHDRPSAALHFSRHLELLIEAGLVDRTGRPVADRDIRAA